MAPKPRSPAQVRNEGMRALLERLGPADTIRFLQAHELGEGDYTRERHQWLDHWTIDEVSREVIARQNQPG